MWLESRHIVPLVESHQPRWFPAHYRHSFPDCLSILILPAQQPEAGIRAFSRGIGVVMETLYASAAIDLGNDSDSERHLHRVFVKGAT